jgi:hypothetical protein
LPTKTDNADHCSFESGAKAGLDGYAVAKEASVGAELVRKILLDFA